jgi:hypothetical protein
MSYTVNIPKPWLLKEKLREILDRSENSFEDDFLNILEDETIIEPYINADTIKEFCDMHDIELSDLLKKYSQDEILEQLRNIPINGYVTFNIDANNKLTIGWKDVIKKTIK